MIRSAVGRVMWVGKGAVLMVGLVAIRAAVFAVANAVLGAGGGPSVSGGLTG